MIVSGDYMKSEWVLFLLGLTAILFVSIEFQARSESRIKIGIIDSGISYEQSKSKILCENGRKTFIDNDSGYDNHGHGTNIFGLVSKKLNPKKYCIISYKYFDIVALNTQHPYLKAILEADHDEVKYLNESLVGYELEVIEYSILRSMLIEDTVIAVAAGNDSKELKLNNCNAYPACYKTRINDKNFHVVGAYDVKESNYGPIVTDLESGLRQGNPTMTGTSQATAVFLNKLIRKNNE
jgi:hypothetical protein